jgi:hypothetical protein
MSNTPLFNDCELKIIKIIASGDFKLALQLAKSQKINITRLFKRLYYDFNWIQRLPSTKTAFEAVETFNENNLITKVYGFEHFQFLKMLNASCITINHNTSVENIPKILDNLQITELCIENVETNLDCYLNNLKVIDLHITNSNVSFENYENAFVKKLCVDSKPQKEFQQKYKITNFSFLHKLPNLRTFCMYDNS